MNIINQKLTYCDNYGGWTEWEEHCDDPKYQDNNDPNGNGGIYCFLLLISPFVIGLILYVLG